MRIPSTLCGAVFYVLTCLLVSAGSVSTQAQTVPELAQDKSIQEILRIIADHKQPTPAQIKVSLKNGHWFEGYVSSFSDSKNVITLTSDDGSTTAIDKHSIASLTIIEPGSALYALRGNKIYRVETSTIPSRLALMRRIEAFNVENPTDISLALTATELGEEDCRFYTAHVLDEIERGLKQAGTDELGREAIGKYENGMSISHIVGSELLLTSNDGGLALSFDCKSPLPSNFGESLSAMLNGLL